MKSEIELLAMLDELSKNPIVDNPQYTCHEESGFEVVAITVDKCQYSIDNEGDIKMDSDYYQIPVVHIDTLNKVVPILNLIHTKYLK